MNFFKLTDAVNSKNDTTNIFIIANERIKKDGSIGRIYTVFPNFKTFLKNRNKFKHCHELIVDHINNKPNLAGRLVFDFDIKYEKNITIPKKFKNQIEKIIIQTIDRYYQNVDLEILEFVWSSCENENKLSKHLTVKNFYFENWISMIKLFYQLFCIVWDETYDWIPSKKIIDFQIARKNASLRMVGSEKIGGNILQLDDDHFSLEDSLIRIYTKNNNEQLITDDYIKKSIVEQFSNPNTRYIKPINPIDKLVDQSFPKIIYAKAFEICDLILPNIFQMGKINGTKIDILRIKKHKCLMSDRIHENENAFLIISKIGLKYEIRFGCYRYCNQKYKTYHIGDLSVSENQIIFIDNSFL